MLTGYVGAALALLAPLGLALWTGTIRNWAQFFERLAVLVVLLTIVLCIVDYVTRRHELDQWRRPRRSLRNVWRAALVRWGGWLVLLAAGYGLYHGLHHYRDDWYTGFKDFYRGIIVAWACGGIPYYLVTLRTRYGRRWDRKDPGFLTAVILRRMGRNLRRLRRPWHGLKALFFGGPARIAWRGLAVKAFFLPLMTTFFSGNARQTVEHFQQLQQLAAQQSVGLYRWAETMYHFSYNGLFMIDVTLATIGYALTTRWLDNGVRSVEYTGWGWTACLAAYKPFNDLTGWYLRWPSTNMNSLPDTPWKLAIMAAILLLLAVYVWATLAFGLRFSNLTHRGIFTQGPYRFVRHPAYAAKNLSWWLEYLPSFSSWRAGLYMLGWNLIYGLRAWTEERHLASVDEKYRRYRRHVRWRFVPGLF